MNFSQALKKMKMGRCVARKAWKDTCYIRIQFPDSDSLNTLPYIQMVKGESIFPCNLSCVSLLADDWLEIPNKKPD